MGCDFYENIPRTSGQGSFIGEFLPKMYILIHPPVIMSNAHEIVLDKIAHVAKSDKSSIHIDRKRHRKSNFELALKYGI